MNLQPLGSEPSVLPIEPSLKIKCRMQNKDRLARFLILLSEFIILHSSFPILGERLDSNQQPEAYEAPALPLSYAPEKAAGRHRTGDPPFTKQPLCQTELPRLKTCSGRGSNPQPPVWKTGTLPIELPLQKSFDQRCGLPESNQACEVFQTSAPPRSLTHVGKCRSQNAE